MCVVVKYRRVQRCALKRNGDTRCCFTRAARGWRRSSRPRPSCCRCARARYRRRMTTMDSGTEHHYVSLSLRDDDDVRPIVFDYGNRLPLYTLIYSFIMRTLLYMHCNRLCVGFIGTYCWCSKNGALLIS